MFEQVKQLQESSTFLASAPNHQRWYAKCKLSCNIYTLLIRFCTFGADLYAQSVLINKNSASELTRKFIKSAGLVGQAHLTCAYEIGASYLPLPPLSPSHKPLTSFSLEVPQTQGFPTFSSACVPLPQGRRITLALKMTP